jgi:hypothetical protein
LDEEFKKLLIRLFFLILLERKRSRKAGLPALRGGLRWENLPRAFLFTIYKVRGRAAGLKSIKERAGERELLRAEGFRPAN